MQKHRTTYRYFRRKGKKLVSDPYKQQPAVSYKLLYTQMDKSFTSLRQRTVFIQIRDLDTSLLSYLTSSSMCQLSTS